MIDILLYIFSKDFWIHSGILFLCIIIFKLCLEYYIELPSGSGGRDQKQPKAEKNFNLKAYASDMLKFTAKVYCVMVVSGTVLGILQSNIHGLNDTILASELIQHYISLCTTWTAFSLIGLVIYFGIKASARMNPESLPKIPVLKEKVSSIKVPSIDRLKSECPPLTLLKAEPVSGNYKQQGDMKAKLEQCFKEYDLDYLKIVKVETGPTITRFTVSMNTSGRLSAVIRLEKEMSMFLHVNSIRISPSANGLVIEVPNSTRSNVSYHETISLFADNNSNNPLEIPLGKTAVGELLTMRLDRMPHLLIAGSTGSGKSVCINGIIASILLNATPEEVRFIFIDPKVVEFSGYNGIPHLLSPVITDPTQATRILDWAVQEMEDRYIKFAEARVRNIESYNSKAATEHMPCIVIVIDELADLIMVARKSSKKEDCETAGSVEDSIQRLGQKARAAGLHLVVGTQRPSADIVTGIIKTNIPGRIAFAVADGTNSRIILDENGAEKLLGCGDGLLLTTETRTPVRFQSAFISDEEVENIVEWWKSCVNYSCFSSPLIKHEDSIKNLSIDTVEATEVNHNDALEIECEDEYYIAIKKYVAQVALEDDEDIYLPSTREISQVLGFSSKTYVIENFQKLISEEWIEKIGENPRNTKYKITVSQIDASKWLTN